MNRTSFVFGGSLAFFALVVACAESEDVEQVVPQDGGADTKVTKADTGDEPEDASSSDTSVKDTGGDVATGSCGDGTLIAPETCDDGNANAGDGCSATCTIESGFVCTGTGPASCHAICGNSTVESREGCDPGTPDAASPGCTSHCSVESGFVCTGGSCKAICGDGVVLGTETCDDGALNGEPAHCNKLCTAIIAPACGDGRIQAGEGCDDGANNGAVNACPNGCPLPVSPLPTASGTFSSNVRGYWFTAPSDFVITTLDVPKDASSAARNIAVVRLPAAPPAFSTTTNTFDLLYLAQNDASASAASVKIPISKNDIIGILGNRGDVNSYGAAGAQTIDGTAVTLGRFGMQFALSTNAPKELWSEGSGAISRVSFGYAKPQCGDGVKSASEACDDGNLRAGDGCSDTCTVEVGFACSQGPVGIATSTCTATCGDSTRASSEGCDDGANNGKATFCDSLCRGKELGIGLETTTAAGKSQGFWFTAPAAFSIRGLRVPATAGVTDQSVAVVKFVAAPPNGGVTNAFQTLAYVHDIAGTNFINVNLRIAAGEVIGVLGSRGSGAAAVSSMAAAPIATTINGNAVTLAPLSASAGLAAGAPYDLVASSTGATGRVELLAGL